MGFRQIFVHVRHRVGVVIVRPYIFLHLATEGGVELGLYPKEALQAALQTVKGAAMLADAHGTHPEQEIDKVTTPGGITIRGLNAMEEAGFSNAVIQGLKIWK
ncbi:MAG: hypothetical protein IKH00_03525 [Bacteroidales bacterium]|nr:hypothetical protein [Bacteroidales bacterium]